MFFSNIDPFRARTLTLAAYKQAKLQMRPLRIPMEHDERENKANGKDATELKYSIQCTEAD